MQDTKDVDKRILTDFHDGDRHAAFRLLIDCYKERLYYAIRKFIVDHDDTDDVLQNTFIKAYKGLDGFRADSQLYSWLYRIAVNESYTFLEKKKRKAAIPLASSPEPEAASIGPDPEYIAARLHEALSTLPEKQRLVFQMKYFEEMKYEEISASTGTSVGALKSSYHIAVKKIEEYLRSDQTFGY